MKLIKNKALYTGVTNSQLEYGEIYDIHKIDHWNSKIEVEILPGISTWADLTEFELVRPIGDKFILERGLK